MSNTIDLLIERNEFTKRMDAAILQYNKEVDGDTDLVGTAFSFPKESFSLDSTDYRDGTLTVYGSIGDDPNKPLGWAYISVVLNTDTVIQIIEEHVKRLNKLKTVLEATK